MKLEDKFEKRIDSLLNFTFKALGVGYTVGSVYGVYRIIAGNEPAETKAGYVVFSAIGGFLGYVLLNDGKKEEKKEKGEEKKWKILSLKL